MGSASNIITSFYNDFDQFVYTKLSSNSFTSNLVATSFSRLISVVLFASFIALLSYESIYWSGIYLNLWEYHAKDIFTEVPVHCAHVYVRINICEKTNLDKIEDYYKIRQNTASSVLNWKRKNELAANIFKLKKFVTYHFEFSPEDFENNSEPEYGSTVEHLRAKVQTLFNSSEFYKGFQNENMKTQDVLVFNNRKEQVKQESDLQYLSKVHIETGNVIDCLILQ